MAERLTGIQVDEEAGSSHSISEAPTAVTAFVGRCLRGPVDRAVRVAGFAEFQRLFGGLWQPSPLSYAVEQYFENGGRVAVIVRVANGARCCTLSLPAGSDQRLELQALAPGTREFLRAAVDYDGIGENEETLFNLVIQRVRTPGSEHIEDQEIYRRLSVGEDAPRSLAQSLAESQLVRIAGEAPLVRPDATPRSDPRGLAGYVLSGPDADDGAPLSDYDIIGSAAEATGLFALAGVEFNQLCIPPLARAIDIGASTLLVANRYCRERRAILFVDPPQSWDTAVRAQAEMRDWALPTDSACLFFPRLLGYDKLRGRFETFAPCGAVAGAMSRASELWPVWSPSNGEEAVLRPGLRPACAVDDDMRQRLAAVGVNTVQTVRRPGRESLPICTLAGPGAGSADWRSLAARRLAHLIVNSIEQGTRWMIFEPNEPPTWRRAEMQVRSFLASLEERGAFAHRAPGDRWFVICNERVNRDRHREQGIVNLMFGFPAARAGGFHAYLITHRAGGSRVQTVSPNLAGIPDTGLTQVLAELDVPAVENL